MCLQGRQLCTRATFKSPPSHDPWPGLSPQASTSPTRPKHDVFVLVCAHDVFPAGMQVPLHIAAACCGLLPSCNRLGVVLTAKVCCALLTAAAKTLAVSPDADTGLGSCSDSRRAILDSFAQQLEQGGLLDQLPSLFIYAAELLHYQDRELLAHTSPNQADYKQQLLRFSNSPILPTPVLIRHALMLFAVQSRMLCLWPADSFTTHIQAGTPKRLVAAMQLELAALQYVSSCLELLPAGATPPKGLWELFTAAARGDKPS